MVTHNFETLRRAVIAASVANGWAQAVVEWQVVGCSRGLKSLRRGTGSPLLAGLER